MATCVESYPPPNDIASVAHCSGFEQYKSMYDESVKEPAKFWGKIADEFFWKKAPSKDDFLKYNFDVNKGPISIKWMTGGITNVSYNVLDHNIKEKSLGDAVCFYWEGNNPEDSRAITYSELLKEVCKFANVLKSKGVKKGDRVAIYMPQIIETAVAMLACARIGAVHSIVFGGFSADSLANRMQDAKCSVLITADGCWRGTKLLNLKLIADAALKICKDNDMAVKTCITVRHVTAASGTGDINEQEGKRPTNKIKVEMVSGRDLWWDEVMTGVSDECEPEWMDAEDPFFMLYTSGSTGKPKGVLHTCAGYLLYAATTLKYVFDYHPGEVYWCTADVGWITGHSYVVYGPMANGATSVMFEGTPFHPGPERFWEIVDKYKVSKFYTAPTAIRSLMKFGDEPVKKCSRATLKVLGSVGEPINPEAWLWYYKVIGDSHAVIVDTFWQTETGGHVVTPLPGATTTKPGAACFPFFGVVPVLMSEEGRIIEGEGEGYLVFKQPWPGIMRTVYGNQERFETTYFKKFPGYYCTGDGARRDSDGYLWITGRIDDMMNMSGHLLSTSEVESALVEHPGVAEAAVVSHPHAIKGECLYCFITLTEDEKFTDDLKTDLKQRVRKKIGPFATPDFIQDAPGLPKTRSGKIMRRVLRKIAVGDRDIGDVTTMADMSVVDELFLRRPKDA